MYKKERDKMNNRIKKRGIQKDITFSKNNKLSLENEGLLNGNDKRRTKLTCGNLFNDIRIKNYIYYTETNKPKRIGRDSFKIYRRFQNRFYKRPSRKGIKKDSEYF